MDSSAYEVLSSRQLSSLLSISEDIASIRNRNDLFTVIMQKVRKEIGFDYAAVIVLSEDRKTYFQLLTTQYEELSKMPAFKNLQKKFKLSSFHKSVLMAGESIIKQGKDLETAYKEQPDVYTLIKELKIEQTCFIAIKIAKEPIGILALHSRLPLEYTVKLQHFVEKVAGHVAIAVNNVMANEKLNKIAEQNKELSNLVADIHKAITPFKSRGRILQVIKEQLAKLIPVDSLYLTNEGEETQEQEYYFIEEGMLEGIRKDADVRAYIESTKTRELPLQYRNLPITAFDLRRLPPEVLVKYPVPRLERAIGLKSAISIPLRVDEQAIGRLVITSFKEDAYKADVFPLLETLAQSIAIGLCSLLQYEKLQRANDRIEALNKQLSQQNAYLLEEVRDIYGFGNFVGSAPAIKSVYEDISKVARTDTTVLIQGETGTGKELVARALHENSGRKDQPLIKINCAALPAQLIESELFGHEKGAFTGAYEKRVGKFELAHKSTLFLDEIGELPLDLQAKLLRAIQEKEIERLGSNKTIKVDVRIIAATNRNLNEEVVHKNFRADLYYRLNVYSISLPPLRERLEDILPLAGHFIEIYSRKIGKKPASLSKTAATQLLSYHWPGNIRELEHLIERTTIQITGNRITEFHFQSLHVQRDSTRTLKLQTLEENEREYLLYVLKHCRGKLSGKGSASEILAIPYTTLQSKMKRLGITKQHVHHMVSNTRPM